MPIPAAVPPTVVARLRAPSHISVFHRIVHAGPGLALACAVAAAAAALQGVEHRLAGRVWLEALVIAILLGAAVRTAWSFSDRWRGGVEFAAKVPLEVAVALLGASVSAQVMLAAGPWLLAGIAVVVSAAIVLGYGVGRCLGLPWRAATLIACGNAICGNSAIAAVAPVIGADGEEVCSAIAFTAVLGVVVVLALPLLGAALHWDALRYGALAGLTVYAVPQVLAAAAPMGSAAVQAGTLVKLARVLMLGPVCMVLAQVAGRRAGADGERPARLPLHRLVPWFIVGFVALAAARTAGVIPVPALPPIAAVASVLTVVAMAALGLSTDVRAVVRAGRRTAAAVVLSLLGIGGLAVGLIVLLRLP